MNQPQYHKANDYQLRQVLKKMTGRGEVMNEHEFPGWQDMLGYLMGVDALRLPFDLEHAYLIYERLPVLGQLAGVPSRSSVGRIVTDRQGTVGVFVDQILSGAAAIYCVAWMQEVEELNQWTRNMSSLEIYSKPMGGGTAGSMVLAPLRSFLVID